MYCYSKKRARGLERTSVILNFAYPYLLIPRCILLVDDLHIAEKRERESYIDTTFMQALLRKKHQKRESTMMLAVYYFWMDDSGDYRSVLPTL